MACYFGFDHVVWMGQIGLTTNTKLVAMAQKLSTVCWLTGSLCTIGMSFSVDEFCYFYLFFVATQCLILAEKLPELDEDLLPNEKAKIRKELNRTLLILVHGCFQVTHILFLLS